MRALRRADPGGLVVSGRLAQRTEQDLALLFLIVSICLGCASAQDRPATAAGSFYPSDPEQLAATVDRLLAARAAPTGSASAPMALIVPHAGYPYSGAVGAQAYSMLKGRSYRRVIIIGPSHVEAFAYTAVFSGDAYVTPLGKVAVDREFARKLAASDRTIRSDMAGHRTDRTGNRGEHSIEVQLPFLQRALGTFSVVPVVMGDPSYANSRALGLALARLLRKDTSTLLVASSDLSHFHSYEQAARMDRNLLAAVAQGDFLSVSHNVPAQVWEACGVGPMLAVMIAAARLGASPLVLGYANSGDVTPERNRVVGYGAVAFFRGAGNNASAFFLDDGDKATLLDFARQAVELAVRERRKLEPVVPSSGSLLQERGVFVTLKKRGQLRGCVGRVSPVAPLYQTVAEVAVLAALRDPRFPPVKSEELGQLEYEISVLSPFSYTQDSGAIRVGEHGLLVRRGYREGVLLPQVAPEQGWDRTEFLRQACAKAGLDPEDCPDSDTDVFTFTALYFSDRRMQQRHGRR